MVCLNLICGKVTELINQYVKKRSYRGTGQSKARHEGISQDFEEEYKTNGNYEDILPYYQML